MTTDEAREQVSWLQEGLADAVKALDGKPDWEKAARALMDVSHDAQLVARMCVHSAAEGATGRKGAREALVDGYMMGALG